MERLGIFGGTFDPPHVGHLVVAVNARHAFRLDRLLLVVAHDPWQKTHSARYRALSIAWRWSRPRWPMSTGSRPARWRSTAAAVSYSADTLAALRDEDPSRELFLVVGSDAAAGCRHGSAATRCASWPRSSWPRDPERRTAHRRRDGHGRRSRRRASRCRAPTCERIADGRPLDYLLTPAVIDCIRSAASIVHPPMTDGPPNDQSVIVAVAAVGYGSARGIALAGNENAASSRRGSSRRWSSWPPRFPRSATWGSRRSSTRPRAAGSMRRTTRANRTTRPMSFLRPCCFSRRPMRMA